MGSTLERNKYSSGGRGLSLHRIGYIHVISNSLFNLIVSLPISFNVTWIELDIQVIVSLLIPESKD